MRTFTNKNMRNGRVCNRYKNADRLNGIYPPGTRVILLQMGDDPRPIEPNSRGTVAHVDSMGTVHVNWDNGRTLGVIPGIDIFRPLTQNELDAEVIGGDI